MYRRAVSDPSVATEAVVRSVSLGAVAAVDDNFYFNGLQQVTVIADQLQPTVGE